MAAQSKLLQHHDPIFALYTHYKNRFTTRLKRTPRSARLLAILTLLVSIVFSAHRGKRWYTSYKAEKANERQLLRRNSGLKGKDGSRQIVVPYKNTTAKVTIYPTKSTTFDAHRRLFLQPPRVAGLGDGKVPQVPSPQTKPGLNLAFLHQFLSILSIMCPRWRCKETGLLASHGLFLLLRTYLSLVVARLDGEIVRDLVAANGKGFLWGILKWLGIGSVSSYTNSMIKFLQSKISIAFRTRLTRYIHDLYLSDNLTYYKLHNLDGGVPGTDQLIIQDLTTFCASAASLYSSIGKPLVDLFVFNYQLYRSLGPLALSGLLSNYFLTATLLRRLSPPFGKLKAVEARKEGDFRGLHARLLANAEEIAFYGGGPREKVSLDQGFKDVKSLMEGIYTLKIRYNMLEDFVLKYSWSAFGYLITSLPVFVPGLSLASSSQSTTTSSDTSTERGRMQSFITNKRLMLSLADAGGRMMYSLKDLAELAGSTSRIYTLISTLHRVHASAYHHSPSNPALEPFSLADIQGTVAPGFDGIRLEGVPVVAPALWPQGGNELIEELSFTVRPGEHLLITGPNGVGKSAVARIAAGLWPAYRGLVSRPRTIGTDGVMFLPQRVYLSTGTLRDQVLYPHTEVDMKEAGRRERELAAILEEAKLGYLPDREGGWDTRKDWTNVLSGGEKQRMAIARLLYHEPRYAFIDEGTSAVSSDVEGLLYEGAKAKGITLITISTRASLRRYHSYCLTLGVEPEVGTPGQPSFVGEGYSYTLQRIGTDMEKQSVERELAELRKRLGQVEEWKTRREEIENELRRVVVQGGEVLPPPVYVEKEEVRTVEGDELNEAVEKLEMESASMGS
jgi:ATP-binding cassette subfamily D (ALD) long-chain fatty acid import protein